MHEHEVVVTMEMARELVDGQFPAYAGCALTPVQSLGTVNVLYQLGTEMLLRFPRVIEWATVDKECEWIPYLAPHLPLRVPEPVALGQPTDQYPCIWGIFRWIPGDSYLDVGVHDEEDAACRVAAFVNALHQAALIIPYYRDTNPGFVSLAMQTMHEILQDDAAV